MYKDVWQKWILFHGSQAWEIQLLWLVFQLFYEEPKEKRGLYIGKRFKIGIDNDFRALKSAARWCKRQVRWFHVCVY